MESFMESLNRLKDVHEKEVLGLQNKLRELTTERCRDAQRVEELFAKNQQLREQQKVLRENLRVLENRLRAGLCDRCMVAQELARRQQLELENAQLQGLRHLCILTSEMTRLKGENEALKEELRRLRGPGDGALAPTPGRDGSPDGPSPPPRLSPGSWKAITKKPPGGPEEAERDHAGTGAWGEEKPAGCRTSPGAKLSPGANLPELRVSDTSPQCISNQLHATVAVVRPGSRCQANCGATNGTSPVPSTRSSPPSPASEHGFALDSFLRPSRPSAAAYEALRRSLQADRHCLLNRRVALHLRSPHRSPPAPATAPHSPQPQVPRAQELEAWEDPAGLLGLPSALGQDAQLEGALRLLRTRWQLQVQAVTGGAGLRGPPTPGETLPSPLVGSDSGSPGSEVPRAALITAALPGGQHPQPTGPGSPRRKVASATQDSAPDTPLDLSDRGRGRNTPKSTGQPGPLSPTVAHTPSPEPPVLSRPPTHSPQSLGDSTKGTRAPEPEEPCSPTDPSPSLGLHPSLPSSGGTGVEAGGRPRPAAHPQRPEADGCPEPSTAGVQRPESDELDEPDTSDSEVGLSSEEAANLSRPGERPGGFCPVEHRQGLPRKRKRPSDLRGKASKKPPRGRRKPREPLTAAAGPRGPGDTEDRSPSPSHSSPET